MIIVTDAHNTRIILENMRTDCCIEVRQAVPIPELRALYRQAKLHIIPLYNTHYSSGQTVLLENMSLGRAVLVTKVAATEDYVQDGVSAFCVAPQDVQQLRQKIIECLADEAHCQDVGITAAKIVRQHYTSRLFTERLLKIIEEMIDKSNNNATLNAMR